MLGGYNREIRRTIQDLEGEVWLAPKNLYMYRVSNYGRVKNVFGDLIEPYLDSTNQSVVTLHDGSGKTVIFEGYVWELVLTAFYSPPHPTNIFPIFRTDNHADASLNNLLWGYTRQRNGKLYPYFDDRSEGYGNYKLTQVRKAPVLCNETGEVFATAADASRALGVSRAKISDILHGRRRSIQGYTFKSIWGLGVE